MQRSEQINELATALAKAQAKIKGAKKDALNPHFRSKFADLDGCWEACREPLSSNGLAIAQPGSFGEGRATVTTVLMHSSGQWISSELSIPIAQQTAQAIGAALTYGRRYALCAMVGITQEDDDGQTASQQAPERRQDAQISRAVSAVEKRLDGQGRPVAQPPKPRTPETPFP